MGDHESGRGERGEIFVAAGRRVGSDRLESLRRHSSRQDCIPFTTHVAEVVIVCCFESGWWECSRMPRSR